MSYKVTIIGSGFSGLSAACYLAKAGCRVTVLEKHDQPGGRARKFEKDGFTYDMGPSWYWMPDIFESFFADFGKKVSDYYRLERLSPSYRVVYKDGPLDIPSNIHELYALFDKVEKGSGDKLKQFLKEAEYKYNIGMKDLVYKPGLSLTEFMNARFFKGIFKMDVFNSIANHIRKSFKDPRLIQLLEFPVLFLGALPENTPALYSLMNYADMVGGTWYPKGGMVSVVNGMYQLALELGVQFEFNVDVTKIKVSEGKAKELLSKETKYGSHPVRQLADKGSHEMLKQVQHDSSMTMRRNELREQGTEVKVHKNFDALVSSADYHFTEQNLLDKAYRNYTEAYWEKRKLAPSSLIFYIGVNKKLPNLLHHTLFFDEDFEKHSAEIYTDPKWPTNPLLYLSCTSQSDAGVAPGGCENLMVLIPIAPGLKDDPKTNDRYFDMVIARIEKQIGVSFKDNIVLRRDFATSDFIKDYNSFKGNAYGLANTLDQTAILKPKIINKKVKNLFYTGQLTVPGPGVPPCLISGKLVAEQVLRALK